jgi:hypothetical protein
VSHVQSGKPCQDAVDWWEQEGVAALVVADGHGSDRSPRSDVGAAIAVEVALNALRCLHASPDLTLANLRALKHLADEQLPRLLVRDWRDRVLAHHAATVATGNTTLPDSAEGAVSTDSAGPVDEPVSGLGVPAVSSDARRPCADAAQEPDLTPGMRLSSNPAGLRSFALPTVPGCVAEGRVRLPPNRPSSASPPAPEAGDVLVQYGSTLLTVLAGPEVLLFLQLGDGDILVVADDGTVTRPMPEDSRLMANETTSLCTVDAWREIRVALHPLVEGAPALILLATDGYANSFVSEQDFLRVGPDYLQAIREEGLAAVASRLDEWLADASTQGSGDDITLGIVARSDVAEGAEHELREGAPS